MTEPIKQCMNCGQDIRTGPYCEHCGQRNVHARLNFRELIEDVQSQILETNLPWLFTIKELTLRPGKVCREYVEGKRVSYVNPLKYAVYVSAIATFLSGLLPIRYQIVRPPVQGTTYLNYNWVQKFLYNNSILIFLVACLISAFFVRILYPRTKFNKTEINSAILFIVGHLFLLLLLLSYFSLFFLGSAEYFFNLEQTIFTITTGIFLTVLLPILYVSYSSKEFFCQSWLKSFLKSVLLAFLTLTTSGLLRFLVF